MPPDLQAQLCSSSGDEGLVTLIQMVYDVPSSDAGPVQAEDEFTTTTTEELTDNDAGLINVQTLQEHETDDDEEDDSPPGINHDASQRSQRSQKLVSLSAMRRQWRTRMSSRMPAANQERWRKGKIRKKRSKKDLLWMMFSVLVHEPKATSKTSCTEYPDTLSDDHPLRVETPPSAKSTDGPTTGLGASSIINASLEVSNRTTSHDESGAANFEEPSDIISLPNSAHVVDDYGELSSDDEDCHEVSCGEFPKENLLLSIIEDDQPFETAGSFQVLKTELRACLDQLKNQDRDYFIPEKAAKMVGLAAIIGHSEFLKFILGTFNNEHKVATLTQLNSGLNVAHMAAYLCNIDIISQLIENMAGDGELLFQQKATTISPLFHSLTPVHIAARLGENPDILSSMLNSVSADSRNRLLRVTDINGDTPLHVAATYTENPSTITTIMHSIGIENKVYLNSQRNKKGQTPAHCIASRNNIFEILTVLIDELGLKSRMSVLSIRDKQGNTPLHLAGEFLGNQKIRDLLGAPFRDESKPLSNESINAVIQEAAHCNQELVVNAFFDNDLNPADKMDILRRKDNKGSTPLHTAVISQNKPNSALIYSLLTSLSSKQKTKLLKQLDNEGCTPLHRACLGLKDVESIKALLSGLNIQEKSALLQMRDADGDTPVNLATKAGSGKSAFLQMLNEWKIPLQQWQI